MVSVKRISILIMAMKGQFTHASCSSPASIETDDNKREDFKRKNNITQFFFIFSTNEAH